MQHSYDTFNLTHLPVDKMAAVSQTIFADPFNEWKLFYFDENFTAIYS